ncbi:glycosyltransferase [Synechococcus sp. WH 8016]|uniref:glycosyltransferase n=1 Tax=Synechococcus sp. WH 8016 TaxID=166318 RepID=UPI00022D7EF6|nr:glycosyltransferase [Synechococcus sp. WH 8016]EHA62514.1 glycosyl transferase group 1 [Synechococcus sp. WH 8016]
MKNFQLNQSILKGKKILITALDLEQQEHRGIAMYSKALIHHLNALGAEVWLLTQFSPHIKDLKKLPTQTQTIIFISRTLDALEQGKVRYNFVGGKYHMLNTIMNKVRPFKQLLIELIRRPRQYRQKQMKRFDLTEVSDNPNMRTERLKYLQSVKGIVCLDNIYTASQIAAILDKQKPVSLDLDGFDAFITSCPLNLRPLNVPIFIQTIHDLIALEYAPHNENMRQFSHRLQACLPSRRIFVSTSTKQKFKQYISFSESNKKEEDKEVSLIQPTSLNLPDFLDAQKEISFDLPPSSQIMQTRIENDSEKILNPFRYILFNSSVESRKNLLFLVKSFIESGLGNEGIRLCITGKLKEDSYSKSIKKIVVNDPSIFLTGYVDESTKLELYLNALMLASPSLVEGFGIPVLDAACLGLPVLASSCKAHQEIKNLKDFNKIVHCINTLDTRRWASAMQSIASIYLNNNKSKAETRIYRLSRFSKLSREISLEFQDALVKLILTN